MAIPCFDIYLVESHENDIMLELMLQATQLNDCSNLFQASFMDHLNTFPQYLEWSYDGVNASIAGNGGPECANFLSLQWRICETVMACLIAVGYFCWGYSNITYPSSYPYVR